jgi:hypothetical protein
MSAFAEALEIFAGQNIPVIPTRGDAPHKPMVLHPDKFGVQATVKLGGNPKFIAANAAIWTGPRSRLTVVDVDSPDPAVTAEAIKIFGDSPLKVRTPSGGVHLYFRNGGEGRRCRPFGRGFPLDVLGEGLAVVPPSTRAAIGKKLAGGYTVLEGDLRALGGLPPLRSDGLPKRAKSATNPQERTRNDFCKLREGDGRDNALFDLTRQLARDCISEAELIQAVITENAKLADPLPVTIAMDKARRVWGYKLEGRLLAAGSRVMLGTGEEWARCAPYAPAWVMLSHLRMTHGHSDGMFAIVPEAIGPSLSMSHMTVRKARDWLLAQGLIELRKIGGRFRSGQQPNLYALKASL